MLALTVPVLTAALAARASDFTQGANQEVCRKLPFDRHLYVNLERLVVDADQHANTCVRTKGRLRLQGRAKEQGDAVRGPWMLTLEDPESGESVSITPRAEIAEHFNEYVLSIVGRAIEVAGFFSVGPPHWIAVSSYEVIPERTVRRRDEILSACDVAGSPEAYLGQKVVVWAPFRGRNVFRDLPEDGRPDGAAWVVGDEDCAVWITGHTPSGKGFSLEVPPPAVRWLKVEGRLERRGKTVVLNASNVTLANARE